MGKGIVGTTMSLDGFMNDRDDDVSLQYPDLEALRRRNRWFRVVK
jgi:hypothetical protein